jgi:hypothetical protein
VISLLAESSRLAPDDRRLASRPPLTFKYVKCPLTKARGLVKVLLHVQQRLGAQREAQRQAVTSPLSGGIRIPDRRIGIPQIPVEDQELRTHRPRPPVAVTVLTSELGVAFPEAPAGAALKLVAGLVECRVLPADARAGACLTASPAGFHYVGITDETMVLQVLVTLIT